jgi:serine/threonine-protein kinase
LPDGDFVLFTTGPPANDDSTAEIVVQSLSTGERTVLVPGGTDARYLPTGHLIYAIENGLFAVVFDRDTLTVFGGAVPLVQGTLRATPGFANFAVSDDGTLVYARGVISGETRTLAWVDREGREEAISASPRAYTSPRISPDGTRAALNARDQDLDIWTWDFARETLTRLTFDPGQDRFPVWSPDGERIAYSSQRSEGRQFSTAVDWRPANGTGIPERLAESSGQIFPHSFLPDATGIVVYGASSDAESNQDDDVGTVRLDGEVGFEPLLETTFGERTPDVSADGRWLAYTSDESGSEEVYVRPLPDIDAGRWQVSTGGGTEPLWGRDGRELFYRNDRALLSVPIQTNPSFVFGNPEVLFEGPYVIGGMGGRNYDVAPDGERFLMIKPVENDSETSDFIIVQNWFEELERLAPISD